MDLIDILDKYSYCGFVCRKCPVYYENRKKDVINNINSEKQENKQKNHIKQFESKICFGCKEETEFKFHKDCNIALCAEKKGIAFCGLCPDFPCVFYSNFTIEAIENIYKIKKDIQDKKDKL